MNLKYRPHCDIPKGENFQRPKVSRSRLRFYLKRFVNTVGVFVGLVLFSHILPMAAEA